MPQVGSNNEALYERAQYVYTGSLWVPLKADAAGQLAVGLIAGQVVEVTQATPADLQATVTPAAGQSFTVVQATPADLQATVDIAADQNIQARAHAYIGAAWQKQPLQFGYGGAVCQSYSNTDLPAGGTTASLAAVPANTVYVITQLSAMYVGTVTNVSLSLNLSIGGTVAICERKAPPASNVAVHVEGTWALAAGDFAQLYVSGATLHDDVYFYALGYQFALNL